MTEETKVAMRANKSSRIIESLHDMYGLPLVDAADLYYTSPLARLIEEGVADLHCRSDKYLASILWDEHKNTKAS